MPTAGMADGSHDFDFLWGTWHIANRRLISRLVGSDEWEEFEARGTCRSILSGSGNVDDFVPVAGSPWLGFEGGALRLFNPETGRWSIHWFDNMIHRLLPPMLGHFTNGFGEFFGDDKHDGLPVLVRFNWTGITPGTARWEQTFSADDGQTWEINWVMTFTRIEEPD